MEVARFAPRQVLTKYQSCSVRGCNSKSHKDLTISFHKFPKPEQSFVKVDNQKVDRFLAWKTTLEIDRITPKTKVCSLHFLKSDYFFPEIQAQKRILKKIAVPSCNLPGDKGNKATSNAKSKSVINENPRNSSGKPSEEYLFVNIKVENDVDMEEENFESTSEFSNYESIVIKPEIPSEPFFKDAAVQVQSESPKPSVKDAQVQATPVSQFPFEAFIKKTKKPDEPTTVKDAEAQVNTDCFVFNVMRCITSDEELLTSTGIESFDVLATIVQRMKEICGDKFEHPNMRMNTRDRVIMTYMKFKHDLSYSFLSILFKHYTAKHCQRILAETLEILGKCSRDGIPWPSMKDMPKNFKKYFQDDSVSDDLKTKQRTPSSSELKSYSRAVRKRGERKGEDEKGKEEELARGALILAETNASNEPD